MSAASIRVQSPSDTASAAGVELQTVNRNSDPSDFSWRTTLEESKTHNVDLVIDDAMAAIYHHVKERDKTPSEDSGFELLVNGRAIPVGANTEGGNAESRVVLPRFDTVTLEIQKHGETVAVYEVRPPASVSAVDVAGALDGGPSVPRGRYGAHTAEAAGTWTGQSAMVAARLQQKKGADVRMKAEVADMLEALGGKTDAVERMIEVVRYSEKIGGSQDMRNELEALLADLGKAVAKRAVAKVTSEARAAIAIIDQRPFEALMRLGIHADKL